MLHAERLLKRPKSFRALTGLSPEAFGTLAGEVEAAWAAARAKRAAATPRVRRPGGGRLFKHAPADRLLMVPVYYRTYVTQEFVGVLFGVDAGTVNRTPKDLNPVLASVFRIPEERTAMAEDELAELFFDGTEQPAYRPKRGRRERCSGKKKRHTFKHQVAVARVAKGTGPGRKPRRVRVKAVSRAYPGRAHDKRIYAECRMTSPPGVPRTADSGCQGAAMRTPRKKPRGGSLAGRQKAGNRRPSRRRIAVEHGPGKMKIWKAADGRFRNQSRRKTVMFKNVAGLHNRMFG